MDGAMGTELQKAGIGEGECYESWNLTRPDRVRAIHQAYVDAGATVLLTNTFQADPQSLARHGLDSRLEESCGRAVALARSVVGGQGFVLGDIGPIARATDLDRVMRSLADADALLLETWSDVAALPGPAATPRGLPVLLSLTCRAAANGGPAHLLDPGHSLETVARLAQKSGVAALGVNCGRDIGMDEVIAIVRRYRSVSHLPLFARPNAGTPTRVGDRWVYPLTPQQMAVRLPELLEAGVCMVGGCCGTTPAHIAACRPVLDARNARRGF
jgi:methionine synthase I (cobalamin-dependent)